MRIAIVTFDGLNEIDFFVAAHMLNWMKSSIWPHGFSGGWQGEEALRAVFDYVAPVGEEAGQMKRVATVLKPFIPA